MTLHYEDGGLRLFHGKNLDVLGADVLGYLFELGYHPDRLIPDGTYDSIVTDPPYELGFMGKGWDSSGIAYDVEVWRECFRVLKPGGYLLSFGGTRTWHRIATAIEDAGFEIRDSIAWMYGSGFPKSMNVAKAIAGHETGHGSNSGGIRRATMGDAYVPSGRLGNRDGAGRRDTGLNDHELELTENAKQWEGWGTALKPAFEPIIVARKPLVGTVAANVLAYGTGALNIDATRVGSEGGRRRLGEKPENRGGVFTGPTGYATPAAPVDGLGRWPTNAALDSSQVAELDRQSGSSRSPGRTPVQRNRTTESGNIYANGKGIPNADVPVWGYDDEGGASRFFPVFAAPPSEIPRAGDVIRSMGQPATVVSVEQRGTDLWAVLTEHAGGSEEFLVDTAKALPTFRYEAKAPGSERPEVDGVAHATVKPLDLMRWLVRLVTRPGGRVLDLYAGSGTTGEAALLEGMEVDLIELEADHLPLILARVRKPLQTSLFGDWEAAS